MKFLVLLLGVLFSAMAWAAEPTVAPTEPKYWFEFSIPVSHNQKFDDAKQDSLTSDFGYRLGFGWQPFMKSIQQDDGKLVALLKKLGFSIDLTSMDGAEFGDYLYSIPREVRREEVQNVCYDNYNHPNGRCFYCPSYSGVCRSEAVYGRDTYIKYTETSIAIGTYLPVNVGKRVSFLFGPNVRFYNVREGIQTDALKSSHETSFNAVFRARLTVWNGHSSKLDLVGGVEKSFSGFRYREYSGGVAIRF